jgi:hypothetical protein
MVEAIPSESEFEDDPAEMILHLITIEIEGRSPKSSPSRGSENGKGGGWLDCN